MKIILLMIVLLLSGGNVYSAGDLIVNGQVGIGTPTPAAKLDINADINALNVMINQTAAPTVKAANYQIDIGGSTDVYVTTAFQGLVRHIGSAAQAPVTRGGMLTYRFDSPTPGTSTFNFIYGLDMAIRDMSDNVRNYTGNKIVMFRTGGAYEGTGSISVVDLIGALIVDPVNYGALSATNAYGVKIEQQSSGSTNYGLVLDGDGAGADVVFGDSGGTRPRIYSESGYIYADDAFGSHTKISPHDPETGEWVYYSKNLKTGKVVKVNMEKLVKAVEKITGETFMIETIEEIE